MGATWFESVSDHDNVAKAFKEARQAALWDYGHAGYTGTIAEKSKYTVIDLNPHDINDIEEFAWQMNDDPRVSDKWGPAGAIKLKKGWYFFGWASC